jgi:hypothetical protein
MKRLREERANKTNSINNTLCFSLKTFQKIARA